MFFVRSAVALDLALDRAGRREPVVLTTLERVPHTGRPRLYARIEAGWRPTVRLPGSIGDGRITIWPARRG